MIFFVFFSSAVFWSLGKHRWFKPVDEKAQTKSCRYDWFQSESHIVLTVFAKCIDPEHTTVEANSDSVRKDEAEKRALFSATRWLTAGLLF